MGFPTRRLVCWFRARQPLFSRQQLDGCPGTLLWHKRLVFRHDLQQRWSNVLKTHLCCYPGVLWREQEKHAIKKDPGPFRVFFFKLIFITFRIGKAAIKRRLFRYWGKTIYPSLYIHLRQIILKNLIKVGHRRPKVELEFTKNAWKKGNLHRFWKLKLK